MIDSDELYLSQNERCLKNYEPAKRFGNDIVYETIVAAELKDFVGFLINKMLHCCRKKLVLSHFITLLLLQIPVPNPFFLKDSQLSN